MHLGCPTGLPALPFERIAIFGSGSQAARLHSQRCNQDSPLNVLKYDSEGSMPRMGSKANTRDDRTMENKK